MIGTRIVAGIGAGFCYSIALANLAATTETARNFSFLIFTFVSVNFLELYSLNIISDHWGVSGIFVTFIIINLICLMAWPYLPRGKVADWVATIWDPVTSPTRRGYPDCQSASVIVKPWRSKTYNSIASTARTITSNTSRTGRPVPGSANWMRLKVRMEFASGTSCADSFMRRVWRMSPVLCREPGHQECAAKAASSVT